MFKYIDKNQIVYNSIEECLKEKDGKPLIFKNVLFKKLELLIINNKTNKLIKRFNDVQPLYLYPLTILDYCYMLKEKQELPTISINVLKWDYDTDYIKMFKNIMNLKNIEIEITNDYTDKELLKIYNIAKKISDNGLKISFNIKTLNIKEDILIKFSLIGDYFKIFLPKKLNERSTNNFYKKLKIISQNKKSSALFHIKSHLDEIEGKYYEDTIKTLKGIGVDIFQLSKELIPLNLKENKSISLELQFKIRELEKEYNDLNIKFISVKDISTLYYPRFELKENNSSKCYASLMKPYLYEKYFLPCKVNKVINNIEEWSISKTDLLLNKDNIKKFGICCDDCASIFENDILFEVEEIINKNGIEDVEFILEMSDNV